MLTGDHNPRDRVFAGKVALVTGAASGIGRAIAEELVLRGARVEASDLRAESLDRIEALARHGRASVDVSDREAVRAWILGAAERHGRIDFLFNNAGIAVGGETQDLAPEDWTRVLGVTLHGVVHGIQAAYPIMVNQRAGHIVNVASVSGLAPYPLVLPYVTAKHAVVGLSTALRTEAAGHGVRVSVACPGAIRTAIWENSTLRGIDRRRVMDKLIIRTTAESCAHTILEGVAKNRGVILVTAEARLMWALNRISSRLAGSAARFAVERVRRSPVATTDSQGGSVDLHARARAHKSTTDSQGGSVDVRPCTSTSEKANAVS